MLLEYDIYIKNDTISHKIIEKIMFCCYNNYMSDILREYLYILKGVKYERENKFFRFKHEI